MEKGTLDYREKAPLAYRICFDAKGNVIPGKHQSSQWGSRNDSWCFAVHAKLGSLPIKPF
jgi:hypothetical protein